MKDQISRAELRDRVFKIQLERFIELYRLYEQLGGQQDVTAEMGILRRRLVQVRPSRAVTFTRLLCRPFEGFLTDDLEPGTALVLRRHCRNIARLTRRHLDPAILARIDAGLKQMNPDDQPRQLRVGTDLWAEAARVLGRVRIGSPRSEHDLRGQMELVVGCLEIGPTMVTLLRGMAQGRMSELDESGCALLIRLVRDLPANRTGHVRFMMALLARRLDNPASLLAYLKQRQAKLPEQVRRNLDRTVRREVEQNLLADARRIRDDAPDRAETVARIDRLLTRMIHARDGGIRGEASTDALEHLSGVLSKMDRLTLPRGQTQGTTNTAATANKLDVELLPAPARATLESAGRMRETEDELKTVIRIGNRMSRLHTRDPLSTRRDGMRDEIRGQVETLLSRLDAGESGAWSSRASAEAELNSLVYQVELLEGPKAAEQLWLKGREMLPAGA